MLTKKFILPANHVASKSRLLNLLAFMCNSELRFRKQIAEDATIWDIPQAPDAGK